MKLVVISLLLFSSMATTDVYAQDHGFGATVGVRTEAMWQAQTVDGQVNHSDDQIGMLFGHAAHTISWHTVQIGESLQADYGESFKNLNSWANADGALFFQKSFEAHTHRLTLTKGWSRYEGQASRALILSDTVSDDYVMINERSGASLHNVLTVTDKITLTNTPWISKSKTYFLDDADGDESVTTSYGGIIELIIAHTARFQSTTMVYRTNQNTDDVITKFYGGSWSPHYALDIDQAVAATIGKNFVITEEGEHESDIYGLRYTKVNERDEDRLSWARDITPREENGHKYVADVYSASRAHSFDVRRTVEVRTSFRHERSSATGEDENIYDSMEVYTAYKRAFGLGTRPQDPILPILLTVDYQFERLLSEVATTDRNTIGLALEMHF